MGIFENRIFGNRHQARVVSVSSFCLLALIEFLDSETTFPAYVRYIVHKLESHVSFWPRWVDFEGVPSCQFLSKRIEFCIK
jgi:hypothetical protein